MEQIIKEHNIGVITMDYKMNCIGGHDVESVFYECRASEKDFNRMVEHIRENVKFIVGITF